MKISGNRLKQQYGEHIDGDHAMKRKDRKLISKHVRTRLKRLDKRSYGRMAGLADGQHRRPFVPNIRG